MQTVGLHQQFGDKAERPRSLELLRYGVDIFALDYDAILASMYALSISAEGDCYLCVPPDPCIQAAALGASESALSGTALAEALHTFTLDSGASRNFFRNSTTLTPLPTPVLGRLADPSGGPVLAHSSTVLPCPAVPFGSLSGLHLPSFSTNLSSLYTLTAEPPQVAASAHVAASGSVAAPCSCYILSHQNLLWHHRLGHPSLPRLRGMHSCLLVSGLPRSLPPLPHLPAPPCLPYVEGRQRAAPHSSFPLKTAPLQTLHMDVWGPARVSGQGHECYFHLVVDDYTHYTTVFPLHSKGEVPDVLIPWIRAVHFQLRERFCEDLPDLRLHSDRGGEFSSDLLREFCRGEGILQSFTLPASPQQNGVAELRIGLVMEGLVRDTSTNKLSSRTIPRVFLGFPPNAPGWKFYHPTSHRVLPSHNVTFDALVPFYHLFPYRSAPLPPPLLFLAPGPPPVDPLPPQGAAASSVSQVDPLPGTVPVEVDVDSGAARGAVSGGAACGGAEPASAEPGGAELEGAEPGGAESEGAVSWGAEHGGVEPRGPAGVSQRPSHLQEPLSSQKLRKWFAQRTRLGSGAAGAGGSAAGGTGAGGTGATSLRGAGVTAGAGGTRGAGDADPGGARTRGTGAAGAGGVGGDRAGGTGVGDLGAGGAGTGGAGASGPEPLGAVPTMAGPEERGGRVAGGSGESQAQGHPRDSAMAPMQPSLGPPRDEPRVFGLDKFNGDNFAEWSFKMENIFDHYDLLEVMEGTEKRPENDLEKSPWMRKSAQGYLLLGQALGSGQIRHIKPFQREPEKRPKAWAALKGVDAPATAAVVVVLERQMAALRIEEDEAVEEGVQKFFDLLTRLEGADLNYSELQKKTKLLALLPESRSSLIINLNRDLPRLSLEDVKRAILQEDFRRPTLKEALESSDAEEWKKAMESELKSIEENGTWELVELPEGRKAITSKWLFKIKSDADGKIERYKSRLVAKGYQQKEKVDYKELFASVVKRTTLRTLLAGAAIKGWVVKQMDVTTAFLNGVLEEEIFMAQPEEFDDGSGRVLRLKKALYGLKQAPRQWYLKLRGVLEEIGFTPSTADHSSFMLGDGEQRSFMVVYVDDILIFSPSSDLVKEVILKLQDKFKCKALGDCVKGLEEESVGEEERHRFHSLVGSLMYAAVNTRPDVAFATGQLARVVQCPNEEQVATGMRVAKYLGQTATVGLQYSAAAQRRQKGADGVEPGRLFLTAFSDASFASGPEDMTSVGGFVCCVGGGSTAWESKKQVDQALSSVESEYMALFRAVREIVWQRRLLAELGEEQQGPTSLYCDSQGTIALAKNPVLHGLTKHMRVKWHWTRSMVAAGEVELHYVKTTGQPADMMTKRLVEQQHWKCCKLAGMALN
ncbi:unnamed protein product [Closterium sp. NIES-53]